MTTTMPLALRVASVLLLLLGHVSPCTPPPPTEWASFNVSLQAFRNNPRTLAAAARSQLGAFG